MAEILIVEDNPDIHSMLTESLTKQGYQVSSAYSGTEAKMMLEMNKYDLILLDLMLPGMSGEELLQHFRQKTLTPVIVMSAKGSIESKVDVLEMGANDYVVKPFDLRELTARIQVQLNQQHGETREESQTLDIQGLVFDLDNKSLSYQDEEINLTRKEAKIIELFLKHPKKIFTKEEIYQQAWDDYYMGDDKTINVHVSNIRKKLLDQTGEEWIETVWGVGFRLDPKKIED